ncbi:DUF2793 domain-containing protein [Lutimaribacter marinistellae]|uniref:DUF2793 domain-containing protein n=1 Tax=Lutimaribacter marinistellae TaxID=1820329 RepID=A0ABV7TB00_9RHOB
MNHRSPILDLPYLQPAQAQKHVTHNSALEILDAVVQLSVESRTTGTPPAAADPGMRYIVGEPASGDWAGQEGQLAVMSSSGWYFLTPSKGWLAYVCDEAVLCQRNDYGWSTPSFDLQNLPSLGVGTRSDVINKLAIASDGSLFTHAGAGHRMVVNKASPSETASLLLQSAWSGRAEIGLTGDDALSVKVSTDGDTYRTALSADPASGRVSFPSGADVSETISSPQGTTVKYACGTMVATVTIEMGRGDEFGSGTLADMYRTPFRYISWDVPFIAPPTISLTSVCPESTGNHKVITLTCASVTTNGVSELQAFRTTAGTVDITAHVTAHGRWA